MTEATRSAAVADDRQASGRPAEVKLSLALDTHVHFYPMYRIGAALDFAWRNLNRVIDAYHLEHAVPAVAWTRSPRDIDLEAFLQKVPQQAAGWHLATLPAHTFPMDGQSPSSPQDGSASRTGFAVRHDNGRMLHIYRSAQLVSSEKLEVLIIGSDDSALDGQPVADIIRHYGDTHPVILPWGVGKWFGARGQLVVSLLESELRGRFHLGDNSSRPAFWSPVPAFIKASGTPARVYPGTDPLPITGQEDRIGKSGVVLDQLDPAVLHDPGLLRKALTRSARNYKTVFDRREGAFPFLINQIRLRLP